MSVRKIAPGKCGSGAIPQLSPRYCGQREPKMAKRSTISFGLATPMFGLRLAGAMRLPKPRPVSLRRLELTVLLSLLAGSAVASLDPAAVGAAAEYSARHRGFSSVAIQGRRTLLEQNAKTPQRSHTGKNAVSDLP